MAVESITKILGSGSGIDIGALVTSLVEAQFAAKNQDIAKREEKLEAQISGVSRLKEAITGFDTALKSLVRGGTLSSQPTSSNEGVVRVTRLPGSTSQPRATSVTVNQLASAQSATTNTSIARATQFKTGTLTIQFGVDGVDGQGAATFTAQGAATSIAIGENDRTLDGIAAKVNAAGVGITATVVNDGAGARLTFKGATGSTQAFEITTQDDNGVIGIGAPQGQSLSMLAVGRASTTTTINTRAKDAIVTVDGARYTRSTNSITDLIEGMRLDLISASTTPVVLGVEKPGAALGTAVSDFVETYNEVLKTLRQENDAKTGPLRLDNAVSTLARDLRSLTTQPLIPAGEAGAPRTLADLGVATARDGTLSVNPVTLANMTSRYPDAVEEIFADRATSGLSAALGAIAKRMTDRNGGLDVSAATYTKQKDGLADAKVKAGEQAEAMRERLTRQFAGMDARVAAYKSTQTFLDNQIKAWNRSDA